MDDTREFHLGDILSVTTGCLVTPRMMEGIYDILNFMTGDNLFTHQLPRASRECKPFLLEQYPQLKGVDASKVNEKNWRAWLDEQINQFGESLSIKPLPEHAHEFIDPMSELVEKFILTASLLWSPTMNEHVERRAREIDPAAWDMRDNEMSEAFWRDRCAVSESKARATFAADREAGYVLVPKEATPEMARLMCCGPECKWPADDMCEADMAAEDLERAIAAGAVKED